MIGLGRMGANLARRLTNDGHDCVVFDINPTAVSKIANANILGSISIADLVSKLARPRTVWLMVPAGVTGKAVEDIASHMEPGDIIIDGGNSYYRDDILRAETLKKYWYSLRRLRHKRRRLRSGTRFLSHDRRRS